MSTPGNPYYDQLRLLVQLLSYVRSEDCFALKGGTAINLFYRDLPRSLTSASVPAMAVS